MLLAFGAAAAGGVLLVVGILVVLLRRSVKGRQSAIIVPYSEGGEWKQKGTRKGSGDHSKTPMQSDSSSSSAGGSSAQVRLTRAAALLKTWEIDAAEVTLDDLIGEGSQSVVVRGKWKGIEVAAKQPRRRGSVRGSAAAAAEMNSFSLIRREVRALSRVRHPNVVKLYGTCVSPKPMVLMAYAPQGNLQDAVDEGRFKASEDVLRLLAGVARGMEAVHAHGIIHLDLKPENVLIGPLDQPWVTDFGLSTSSQNSMSTSVGGRGTMAFKGPELFVHPPHVSKAVDVYAFAILSWIVSTSSRPYQDMQSADTAVPAAVAQGVRPELANGDDWREKMMPALAKLIEECWVGDHAARPAFAGDGGIVEALSSLEASSATSIDETAQLLMVTRLIADEAEVEETEDYIAKINKALGDADEAQARELKEEREGVIVSCKLARLNTAATKQVIARAGRDGASLLSDVLAMYSSLQVDMRVAKDELAALKRQVASHEMSLASLAAGELDCPRLFVLLPEEEARSKLSRLLNRARAFVKDRYRLVFLDPVTGCATSCGREGKGYLLELPKKWIVDNYRFINDGMKVVKLAAANGTLVGLPLLECLGLPSQVVSKAEVRAVRAFEELMSGAVDIGAAATVKGAKGATGRAYKELQKLLDVQCHDKYLAHSEMRKERAADGTIEFVTTSSKERFIREGQSCLIWNKLAQDAARGAFYLREGEEEEEADDFNGAAETLVDMLTEGD